MHKFALVACARWERDSIMEWITYHRWLGFSHLYLYCNDDDPAELYRVVRPLVVGPDPFVTFHHFRFIGQQKAMYLHFLHNHKAETEWFMFLDIDEFLRLPVHGNIADFAADLGREADAIYLNWCCFGNNGFDKRPSGDVLLNYTRRAAVAYNSSTKMLTRAAAIDAARLQLGPRSDFWHYWNSLENFDSLRVLNVLGEDMHTYYDNEKRTEAWLQRPEVYERLISTAVVNHYMFKSRHDFIMRTERGPVGDFANQHGYKAHFHSGHVDEVMALLNVVDDCYLRDLWTDVQAGGRRGAVFPAPEWPNIALGGKAAQSSAYAPDQANAGAAVNGQVDGKRKFHTQLEDFPWWQVDLGGIATVHEIHVYNTYDDTAYRLKNFVLSVSIDGQAWIELARKTDGQVTGGVVGGPYIWRGPGAAWARFIRVTLLGRDYLHFDQVEVFGRF